MLQHLLDRTVLYRERDHFSITPIPQLTIPAKPTHPHHEPDTSLRLDFQHPGLYFNDIMIRILYFGSDSEKFLVICPSLVFYLNDFVSRLMHKHT